MNTYHVRLNSGEYEEIGADSAVFLLGGVLAFYKDESLVIAYAPGTWENVTGGDTA